MHKINKSEKNILFIASAYKTLFFLEVSKYLESLGYTCYWISPANEWARVIESHGVESKRVISVANYWDKKNGSIEGRELLCNIEANLPYSIREILKIDRNLRHHSLAYGLSYLESIALPIFKLCESIKPIAVVNEQTWAFDFISVVIAQKFGAASLEPYSIRVPSDRMAFFTLNRQQSILTINGMSTNAMTEIASSTYIKFITQDVKPTYFYTNNKNIRFGFSHIRAFIRHLRWSNDESKETSIRLAKNFLAKRCNRIVVSYLAKKWITEPSCGNYVFIPLHMQPENSIDYCDYYSIDQAALIKSIADAVPLDCTVVVKEHSNDLGGRGYKWFSQFKKYENVKFAHHNSSAKDFIRNSLVTISVSGTASLEAALYGVKSICTSNVYFKEILSLSNCSVKDICVHAHNAFEDLQCAPKDKIIEYLTFLAQNSFPGVISDIKIDDSYYINRENIENISRAFATALNQITNG